MAKDHGWQNKDDEQYEALRRQRASMPKSARIANTSRSKAGKRGGKSSPDEAWSKGALYQRVGEIGIEGRSALNKGELIRAMCHH